MSLRAAWAWALLSASISVSAVARADVDARALVRAYRAPAGASSSEPLPRWLAPRGGRVPLLVELSPGKPPARGLLPVTPSFAVAEPYATGVDALRGTMPGGRFLFAPPRQVLLTEARTWIRLERFRAQSSGAGAGAIVGIVDTGLDVTHSDFRELDGSSRVRWLIDFSRPAAGRQAELEAEYGCDSEEQAACAIYSGPDLDALIGNGVDGDEPRDDVGHGTHVTSLAAGNGLSEATAAYAGVAPAAPLIVARVSRGPEGSIYDADILRAARFIFDRAAALGLPAVINLSLGSDFGAHDGSAAIERALAELVGPEQPGRAIVVAAGNSAGLYEGLSDAYPGPFGTHTEVHVPRGSEARVPLLFPQLSAGRASGTVWLWIATRPTDRLQIGVEHRGKTIVEPVPPGASGGVRAGKLNVTVLNRVSTSSGELDVREGALVILDGEVTSGAVYALRLEGQGTARLWVQSGGELAPGLSTGALLPRAFKAGTINIPASHPELIAVGATLNRLSWTAYTGDGVRVARHGALDDPPLDTLALFSSAGPSASGWMKPDLVAPGAFVAGAMSYRADPRANGGAGMFAGQGVCPELPRDVHCAVVDGAHAVASGTSMAAPVVAGAAALLLERDPTLTQPELLALLQAGARRPEGTILHEQQQGPGALDIDGALAVQLAADTRPIRRAPNAERSWLALADEFARPEPRWPLIGVLELRDEGGVIADGFTSEQLTIELEPRGARHTLVRVAPGMWRLELMAPAGSGGGTLRVRVGFAGAPLLERAVPIAVDRSVAEGRVATRGGCAMVPARERSGSPLAWLVAAAVGLLALRQGARSQRR